MLANAPGTGPEKRLHVLVVDDEVCVLHTIQMLGRKLGWVVTVAARPSEALALARQRRPDVILTDYCMPEMNGAALAAAMRADAETADIPIVLMSGNVFVSSPGMSFIEKPFSIDKLKKIVEGAASSRALASVRRPHISKRVTGHYSQTNKLVLRQLTLEMPSQNSANDEQHWRECGASL